MVARSPKTCSTAPPSRPEKDDREVPPDVWYHILSFLARPIPPALSRPPRSALRQGDLCSASRVCRLFQSLCQPLLYKKIVTDDLGSLLKHCDRPPMQLKLAQTRALYIEYGAVGEDVPYRIIVGHGKGIWTMVGRTEMELRASIVGQSGEDVAFINQGLERLLKTRISVFPSLETVAISSIYGRLDDRWADFDRFAPPPGLDYNSTYDNCRVLCDQFLRRCPELRSLCVRDPDGPISMPVIFDPSTSSSPVNVNGISPHSYARTVHFDSTVQNLYLPLGSPVRWVSDVGPEEGWVPLLRKVKACLRRLVGARFHSPEISGSKYTDIDIYCSTGMRAGETLPVETQRAEAQILAAEAQSLFRQRSERLDLLRWHASADSPTCASCLSGPPA